MLNKIRTLLPDLSPAERKVAELLLAQPEQWINLPVAQLAEQAQVSQPTVIRFCRRLDCDGLPEFKLKLADTLANGVPFVHGNVTPQDGAAEIIPKVFDHAIQSLARCRDELKPEVLQQAVDWLEHASRIEFYGLGNSGVTASDAQLKFFRLGTPTACFADSQMQRMSAVLLPPGAVVVAISNSGRTRALLEAIQIARDAGARIIAISRNGTPLAQQADLLLPANMPENPDVYSPMVSRLAHLALIDVLTVALALRRGPDWIARIEATKAVLQDTRLPG